MDLERLETWFNDYTRAFLSLGGRDPRPHALKIEHTGRVRENTRYLADSISLGAEQAALAETIALFHDIGRFPQYRDYGTFRDAVSVNHAALGVKVLLEANVLAVFPERERKFVTTAVALHNTYVIPPGLDDDSLLFTRLIRDADKLDIWRIFIDYYRTSEAERSDVVGLSLPDRPVCSPAVVASLGRGEMVKHETIENQNDFKLLHLSWIFDLNFPRSFRIVLERRYIERLAELIPQDDGVKKAIAFVREYAERKSG